MKQIVTRICKNCGKEYKTCRTPMVAPGEYRWQDVACSPECGAAYLAAVLKARGLSPSAEAKEEDAAKAEPLRENSSGADGKTVSKPGRKQKK